MSKKFLLIHSRSYGVFSNFLSALQYLYLSKVEDRIPIMVWNIKWFRQKDLYNGSLSKVWEYYFEPVSKYSVDDIKEEDDVKQVRKYKEHGVADEPKGCWDYTIHPPNNCLYNPSQESRDFVHSLISEYVKIKQPISDKINNFYEDNIKDKKVLGVHIRAVWDAKGGQRPNVPIDRYIKYIKKYLAKGKYNKVYLATDCKPVFEKIKKLFGEKVIYYNCQRSSTFPVTSGRQHSKKKIRPGALIGEEAIIESVLLSKCDHLLIGMSNLSASALYFNPKITYKIIMVTK